jgi:hypothetical protein
MIIRSVVKRLRQLGFTAALVHLHGGDERQHEIANALSKLTEHALTVRPRGDRAHGGHGSGEGFVKVAARPGNVPIDLLVCLVRLAGFEPATRCLEGTSGRSPEGARCGLMCRLAALMEADCGLA